MRSALFVAAALSVAVTAGLAVAVALGARGATREGKGTAEPVREETKESGWAPTAKKEPPLAVADCEAQLAEVEKGLAAMSGRPQPPPAEERFAAGAPQPTPQGLAKAVERFMTAQGTAVSSYRIACRGEICAVDVVLPPAGNEEELGNEMIDDPGVSARIDSYQTSSPVTPSSTTERHGRLLLGLARTTREAEMALLERVYTTFLGSGAVEACRASDPDAGGILYVSLTLDDTSSRILVIAGIEPHSEPFGACIRARLRAIAATITPPASAQWASFRKTMAVK